METNDYFFKARLDWATMFEVMEDGQIGRLMRALWAILAGEEPEELDGAERLALHMMLHALEQDEERRRELSAKRSASGMKRVSKARQNTAIAEFAGENEETESKDRQDEQEIQKIRDTETENKRENNNNDDDRAREGEAYCLKSLQGMSEGNVRELKELMDKGISDELVCFAVDAAAAQGHPVWAYVRRILEDYAASGIQTPSQAEAREQARRQKKKTATKSAARPVKQVTEAQYSQREYEDDSHKLPAWMVEALEAQEAEEKAQAEKEAAEKENALAAPA